MAGRRKHEEQQLDAYMERVSKTANMWQSLWEAVDSSKAQLMPVEWHHHWRPQLPTSPASDHPLHPHYDDYLRRFRLLDKRLTWLLEKCMDMRNEYWELYNVRRKSQERKAILKRCGRRFRRWLMTINQAIQVSKKIRWQQPLWATIPRPCGNFPKWFTFGVAENPQEMIVFPKEFH